MGLFSRRPTLDSVTFDTRAYELKGEPTPGRQRVWWSPDGDGVGLYLFTLPPDIPRFSTVAELGRSYALQPGPGAVVNTAIVHAADLSLVQLISKFPQEPSGRAYVGALTLPFRDFSFVLKVQCAEHGTTGLREAVLLDRHLAAGGSLDPESWSFDGAEHDAEFPAHPLTRVRRVLAHIRGSLAVDPAIAKQAKFPLPSA